MSSAVWPVGTRWNPCTPRTSGLQEKGEEEEEEEEGEEEGEEEEESHSVPHSREASRITLATPTAGRAV